MVFHDEIDAIGLLCPLPVLKLQKRIRDLTDGRVIKLIADDPASLIDVPHFCNEQQHRLVLAQTQQLPYVFYIKKKTCQS